MNEERQPLIHPAFPSSQSLVLANASSSSTAVAGNPKWKTRSAFMLILGTETLERTAFYGLICNMFLFLNSNPLGWMSYNASIVILVLNGLSYVAAVAGGWIADSCLGKFRTIVAFFVIYVAGFVFWPVLYPYPNPHVKYELNLTAPSWCAVTSKNDSDYLTLRATNQENCWWPVYISVFVIAVGFGTIRVNLIPFGAVQVEHEGQHAMRTYFNWFYWCINIGSLLAYGILGYVQQEKSYFWGYVTPNIILCCAVVVFLSGSWVYIKKPANGSPISTILRVCHEACRICRRQRHHRDTEVLISDEMGYRRSCLDYAKVQNGGSFPESTVDEIKLLFKVLVVFMTFVPYWVVYFQCLSVTFLCFNSVCFANWQYQCGRLPPPIKTCLERNLRNFSAFWKQSPRELKKIMQTTFIWQALHMQLDFDKQDSKEAAQERPFNIPPAWLSLFNVVFILVLLPLLDKVIYPFLDRTGYSPSLRVRILLGMLFSVMSMIAAGCVENQRMNVFWRNETSPDVHWQFIGRTTYYQAARMSVLFQLPQYALIGIGELFTSIAGLELAYIYAPRSMQGIIMSLFWFSQGLGALLGLATIYAFEGTWFTSYDHGNINCDVNTRSQCHLDYYFYFVGGLQLVGMAAFAFASWGLNIGQTIPVRVQRQGCTMVRACDESSPVNSVVVVQQTARSRTRLQSVSS